MKKVYTILMLSLALSIICLNCSEKCDDCQELTTKNIKYINFNGINLLFGNHATYNPDSIIIKLGNDNYLSFLKQEDIGTIMFNLEKNYTTYYIILSDSLIDTLSFELAEKKSASCCGNGIYSTKTLLNGLEIQNNDLIVITH